MKRGYSAIGLYQSKDHLNIGSAVRAAQVYNAAMVMFEPKPDDDRIYTGEKTDTMCGHRHLPFIQTPNLLANVPHNCKKIAVDLVDGAKDLTGFQHPERAIYIFGPEDGTLPESHVNACDYAIKIPTNRCMNLAATVNVVLYDRMLKRK